MLGIQQTEHVICKELLREIDLGIRKLRIRKTVEISDLHYLEGGPGEFNTHRTKRRGAMSNLLDFV